MLTFNTETHTYNNLNQMTRLTITGTAPLDISYNFPAGTNNGKIASQTDNLSGETVTYQYDSLNRLITASGSQSWGETYGFDAFGNLLSKTGTGGAPTLSQSVNTANNQIVGQSYDANGNQSGAPLVGVTVNYDAENRVASASGGVQYAYDSRNKRVWRSILSGGNLAQQVYVYGVDGQKIGTYTFTLGQYGQTNTPEMTNSTVLLATFFGHKRVGVFDRLGSAKYNQSNNAAQSFYPYGEDRGTVEPNDELKFATYTRDAATGLDYADQRYYANNFGRFMSPDPGYAGAMTNPQSLNRYGYVITDPVNGDDPSGLCAVFGAGVSVGSNPSANFDYLANLVGAVTAFPYSGLNYQGGIASVIQQGTSGANSSTQVELAALLNALSQNSGSIDVVAYSGSAEAFTEAYGLLTPQQQARIGSILYLSPAVVGQMVVIPGHTTIVEGAGPKDFLAGIATILPPNVPVISTNCSHNDFACLLTSAFNQLLAIGSDGGCQDRGSFSLLPNGVGGGGVVNTNNSFGASGGNNYSLSWYWQWMMLEPTPDVTSTITYKPIE